MVFHYFNWINLMHTPLLWLNFADVSFVWSANPRFKLFVYFHLILLPISSKDHWRYQNIFFQSGSDQIHYFKMA